MKTNYQQFLENTIKEISSLPQKPKLLLHACCGPCSSYIIEYISKYFDITLFYYNPNIYPQEEYSRRLEELKNLLPRFPEAIKNKVKLVEEHYEQKEYFEAIKINENPELAHEPEKGERCRRCYLFRMQKAWEYANQNRFDFMTTTLSISPFKDSQKINEIGYQLEKTQTGITKFLYSDFKKKGGFKRSLEISSEYNLFRQYYCGCVYSKQSADQHKEIIAGQKEL